MIAFLGIIISVICLLTINKKRITKKENELFEKIIKNNEGKCFFCYSNRKKTKEFIEEILIPELNDEIEIVYLNGKKIESNFNHFFLQRVLYFHLKNYNRFPHLFKIKDGKVEDISINNLVFNTIHHPSNLDQLFKKLNVFF